MTNQPSTISPRQAPRNIVISGTNFWNPGDDFVRDGVVAVLRQVLVGCDLNFLFYNFNADFFPQDKFKGISNLASQGDLDRMRGHVDAVVIAGLSAGEEIKDLYRWVIANGLQDRVFLIGAGYENSYVAQHVAGEPEATIFRHARIITGRTAKRPEFLRELATPYVHLNCPAILSVPEVKTVPDGRQMERIGFSIQLPHEVGEVNQTCDGSLSRLAVDILTTLEPHFAVEVIAHHKSEYFFFLDLLKGTGIPVLFSSFYQDMSEWYRRQDLVITTRLHSSLFANGHGIPGLIVNDTDRHTHTLDGFPHTQWVSSGEAFVREFDRLRQCNLGAIALESKQFKQALLESYIATLREPFASIGERSTSNGTSAGAGVDAAPVDMTNLASEIGATAVKQRVLDVLERLTPDHWLHQNIHDYRKAIAERAGWFDTPSFLNWYARHFHPANYLEIGVRRGRSMSQVLTQSPDTRAFGFDLWIAGYGSDPAQGIQVENPGPDFVLAELARLGVQNLPKLVRGDSHETVPAFLAEPTNPRAFDLILVDGDHSDEGARRDLDAVVDHLAPGGVLIFDDLRNAAHPDLQRVWDEFQQRHPDFLFLLDEHRTGTGVAFKPPFTKLADWLGQEGKSIKDSMNHEANSYRFNSEEKEQALVRRLVKPGMTVFDVGANIGKYTKLFSLIVGDSGRVFAFEPSPNSAQRIAGLLAGDGLKNVTLCSQAVCDHAGTVVLHQFPEEYSSWNSLGQPQMEDPRDPSRLVPLAGKVTVEAVTLDDFCQAHGIERIDYLKLDVEGAEFLALQGAKGLLQRRAVQFLQFEVSKKMLEGLDTSARPVFDLLGKCGYECHAIAPDGTLGPRVKDSDAFYENYLALPATSASENGVRMALAPEALPIHFFTIVLNGRPFIEHHIREFAQLPFRWHWHIVEGVAELKHDTAWSVGAGGHVPDDLHRGGLSNDGTSEYLDDLVRRYPDRVTVYRKPDGKFWEGKLEMVNAPLAKVREECLLWQVDADELWTAEQIERARKLFQARPDKTAAFYFCHYFVGPNLVTTTRDTYGNHTSYEWLRTWRFTPDCRWTAHEPPRLCRTKPDGTSVDIATINPFRHRETDALDLVFQHFAYATEEQARFKEAYYGYAQAVEQWRGLQARQKFPARLREHFGWVKDETWVDTASATGVVPFVRFDAKPAALSRDAARDPRAILFVRTDSIGDAVLASSMLPHLRKAYPSARIGVLCQQHIAELYVSSPFVDSVLCFKKSQVVSDVASRQEIIREIGEFAPDLILNSIHSRDAVTDTLALSVPGATVIAIEGDSANLHRAEKSKNDTCYTRLIPSPASPRSELERHSDFLAGLGIPTEPLQPVVWTTPDDDAVAEAFFQQHALDPARTIALFPGAQHEIRVYPHLGQALGELKDYRFLVFGGVESALVAEQIASEVQGINLVGRTTLREMAALIRKCRLFVGTESAGAHIACALGVPNVVLIGGGHFGRFMPYSPLTSLVCLPMECFGCNWGCRFPSAHCIQRVAPEVITQAVNQTLAAKAAKPRVFLQVSGDSAFAESSGWARWIEAFVSSQTVDIVPVKPACASDLKPEPAATVAMADDAVADEPLVSVLVSTYKSERYIRACLQNLLSQTLSRRIEILVIDSGSPENERTIVEELQVSHAQIRYLRTERETLYAAWNRGICMARGKYISNANCDDALRPDALEKLCAALEANPEADLAYGDYFTSTVPNDSFDHPSIIRRNVHPQYHPATLLFYCVTGCHPMWRRTAFDKVGLFDPAFTAPGDYDFVLRFAQAGLRAVHVPEELSLFYQNPDGLSLQPNSRSKQEFDRIQATYRASMPIERLFRVNMADLPAVSLAWTALGNMAVQFEVPWFERPCRELGFASECFERALTLDGGNTIARHNLAVTLLLKGNLKDATVQLEKLPEADARQFRAAMNAGEVRLIEVSVPPAVEPLEFGGTGSTSASPFSCTAHYLSPNGVTAVPDPALQMPVRWVGSFLNSAAISRASLDVALALSEMLPLGAEDQSDPFSEAVASALPEGQRERLRGALRRFPFQIGGVGVAHHKIPFLMRVPGAAWSVARTAFGGERLSETLVRICNQVDELWVPSQFDLAAFAASGVERDKLVCIPSIVNERLFDPVRYATVRSPRRAGCNFLAVVDWIRADAWDVLLESYLREFRAEEDVCLTLHVTFPGQGGVDVQQVVEAEIRKVAARVSAGSKPLPRIEVVSEPLTAASLPALYLTADCVVIPTRAPAWGRVAHEAMLMERPVIATNAGIHTEMAGAEYAYLLNCSLIEAAHLEPECREYRGVRWFEPSVSHLQHLMRHVSEHREEAEAKGRRARAAMLERFSMKQGVGLIMQRLAELQQRLSQPVCRDAVARPQVVEREFPERPEPTVHVAWEGTFLDYGSLSHVNRELTRRLDQQRGVRLARVAPNAIPAALRHDATMQSVARRLVAEAPAETQITVRHAWPPNWQRPERGAWVLIQPWEFGTLPQDWINPLADVDEIWVPSDYVRRVYVDSGVNPAKVKIVPNGVNPERFRPGLKPLALPTKKSLRFLFVGGTIRRKGPDLLLKAFLDTFTAADDVCLVIKDFGGGGVYAGQTFASDIKAAQSRPNAPEIIHLTQELSTDEMARLYAACDCLVHPYRGEGFGLPVLEAMACGLPVIVTGGGATDDFATDEFCYRIPALRRTVGSNVDGLKLRHSGWLLEPDADALAGQMRWVSQHRDEAKACGLAASAHVHKHWSWENAAQIAAQRLKNLQLRRLVQTEQSHLETSQRSQSLPVPSVAQVGALHAAKDQFRQGLRAEAWNSTLAALHRRPFHPEALALLGEIAGANGDAGTAVLCAQQSLRFAPGLGRASKRQAENPSAPAATRTESVKLTLPAWMEQGLLRSTNRLSVCLITKNEELFLPRCLKSVQGLAAQVVVVDTGSTDRTVEIAQAYGAEVHRFDWCDDFSAARNAGLEHATGDWILVLDADEELPVASHDKLRAAMTEASVMAWRLPIVDAGREEEGCHYVPRLFRNAPGLFFAGRIHEHAFGSVEAMRKEWGLENRLGTAMILHHGYTRQITLDRQKIARNLRLLELALEVMPGDPNLLMSHGLELVRSGNIGAGLDQYFAAYRALLRHPVREIPPELRETLLTQLCTHLIGTKQYGEVIRILSGPLAKVGGLSASLHFLAGLAHVQMGHFSDAAAHMRDCLGKRHLPTLTPINKDIRTGAPHHCLAISLAKMNLPAEADKAFQDGLKEDPKLRQLRFDYARFHGVQKRPVEALRMLHEMVIEEAQDPAAWELGGQIALSDLQFLEFAGNWTSEALHLFPKNPTIIAQRAEALLLAGDVEGSLTLWRQNASPAHPRARAAEILCESLSGQIAARVKGTAEELQVSQSLLEWYRKLLEVGAHELVSRINSALPKLAEALPTAAQVMSAALAEADTA